VHTTLIAVLLALSVAGPPARSAQSPTPAPHVRPLTKSAAALLADATARSPIVKGLVEDLEQTNVVVYLVDSMDGPREVTACLTFVSFAAGTRYLMFRVDRWVSAPWDRIAQLAHELQHAMEIAEAPEVQDAASMARLYKHIGWECGKRSFESAQARITGNLVRDQLRGLRR
jgi:hypothetical protein